MNFIVSFASTNVTPPNARVFPYSSRELSVPHRQQGLDLTITPVFLAWLPHRLFRVIKHVNKRNVVKAAELLKQIIFSLKYFM